MLQRCESIAAHLPARIGLWSYVRFYVDQALNMQLDPFVHKTGTLFEGESYVYQV